MFSTIQLSIALPSSISEEIGLLDHANQARFIQKLSAPVHLPLDSASPRYLQYKQADQFDQMASLFGLNTDSSSSKNIENENEVVEDKEEALYLSSLDPRHWKDQDHYLVLGLHHLRYKATQDEIKSAYLRKALKHHPDKKASQSSDESTSSSSSLLNTFNKRGAIKSQDKENIFKCIQKACDVLSDPIKRQEYDSIDPGIVDTMPSLQTMQSWVTKNTWYKEVSALLEKEIRFAVHPTKLPSVGHVDSTKMEVDTFYEAWYHFESWRRFDYLDKEEVEGENRDDKRYQDKKNKAERLRKLTSEKARLRTLVELIEQTDPRIKLLKEKEKEMKKLMKQAKQQKYSTALPNKEASNSTPSTSTATTTAAATSIQGEKDQAAAKEEKEIEKQMKLEMKKEKKNLKQWLTKTARYLVPEQEELTSQRMEKALMDLDNVLDKQCSSLALVQSFKQGLFQAYDEGGAVQATQFLQLILKGEQPVPPVPAAVATPPASRSSAAAEAVGSKPWSPKEVSLLIKATNLFPGGTQQRWEKIAGYVAEHGHEPPRSISDVIQQSKQLDPSHPSMVALHSTIQSLQEDTHHEHKGVETKKTNAPITTHPGGSSDLPPQATDVSLWSHQQQAQLQLALKTYPSATYKEADRFDKIAAMVEGKSKEACIARCKYLIEQLKSKQQPSSPSAQ